MKTNIKLIALFLTTAIAISCKKSDIYPVTTPDALSTFTNISTATYYVRNDPNSSFKVPIGITTVSNVDRKVTVTVSSPTGAVAGTQYNLASTTATIPAGKTLDSLTVRGLFSGYSSNRVDTLRFTITGGDVPPSEYNKTYNLVLRKYCDVVLTSLTGNYTRSYDLQSGQPDYGPYSTVFSNITSTGATTATARIANFWDVGTSITVNLDWTDPANFKTTIPSQFLYNDSRYGAATIASVGTGNFSACDNSFRFSYTVTVSAGSFGNFTTTIAR